MSYRLDVEGLRAVAVILVVLFHINDLWVPGGFIGVDMFFVISGFVITLWMKRAIEDKNFSLKEFYRRRFKRIFPAMFAVVLVTVIVGIFTLLPADLMSLSWSAGFTVFSAANIYFAYFLDTGYFAADSKNAPLLHLWSLGVEEQFYIVWPLFIMGLMRFRRALVPTLVVLIIGSIVYGQYLIGESDHSFAYYTLPSRMFQLAAGGLIVYLPTLASRAWAEVLSIVGLTLVAFSAYTLTGDSPFPGWAAVPLTGGTALVIISGGRDTYFSRVLALPPLLWIGKRSYSIYLWHWPILAFQHYLFADLSLAQQLGSLFATFALGHLSFRYVEEKTRYSKASFGDVTKKLVIFPAAILVSICAMLIGTNGTWPYGSRFSSIEKVAAELTMPVAEAKAVCIPRITTEKEFDDPRCIMSVDGESKPKVLVWGDSNAAHYVGIINEAAKLADVSIQNISHSACPPLLAKAPEFSLPIYADWCAKSVPYIASRLHEFDTIILGGQWGTYFGRGDFLAEFDKTLASLSSSHRKIIILGQVPAYSGYDRKCFLKQFKVPLVPCERMPIITNGNQDDKRAFSKLQKKYPNVSYVDMFPFFCRDKECSPYVDHRPIYTNGTHLGYGGSVEVGKRAAVRLQEIFK